MNLDENDVALLRAHCDRAGRARVAEALRIHEVTLYRLLRGRASPSYAKRLAAWLASDGPSQLPAKAETRGRRKIDRARIHALLAQGLSAAEVARVMRCCATTVARAIAQASAE